MLSDEPASSPPIEAPTPDTTEANDTPVKTDPVAVDIPPEEEKGKERADSIVSFKPKFFCHIS